MADGDLDQRMEQLRKEQDYWESVRLKAAKDLQEQQEQRENEARENQAKEEAKSRLSTAGFNLDQISQEMSRIERLKEAAREQDPAEMLKEEFAKQDREKQEAFQKEQQQKADFEKQELEKAEAFKKDEQQKADAFRKDEQLKADAVEQERLNKELLNKQEAFAQEQREQELQRQQPKKEESPIVEAFEVAHWIAKEIKGEKDYLVEQTFAAVAEAVFEIGVAIANPITERESTQYLETQQQSVKDFIADEVFQGAPAENKAMWLEEKFKELEKAEQEKFGERKDDFNYRENLQDNLAELQKIAMDAVNKEVVIQDKVEKDLEDLKKAEVEAKERAKTIQDEDRREEKTKQIEEAAKEREAQIRQRAEDERQKVWEKALEDQRALAERATKTQEELARQDAKERAEAERKAREAAEKAARIASLAF
jgi:hypothetical protein